MWENKLNIKMFHANLLWRGHQTVLGETSDPKELFLMDECQDIPLSCIKCKTNVLEKHIPEDWADLGRLKIDEKFPQIFKKPSFIVF